MDVAMWEHCIFDYEVFNVAKFTNLIPNLKVSSLHFVACTRSGSGFPSNTTLFSIVVALDGNPEPNLIPLLF
jgi:hypothetical protein